MTLNGLINMVLSRLLRKGVSRGIDRAASGGRRHEDMTPEERKQARAARQTAKRARQALRASRKIGRF